MLRRVLRAPSDTRIHCRCRAIFRSRVDIALEVLALRQQVAVIKRQQPRPPLTCFDRFFWSTLRRVWPRWSDVLVIVKLDTVIGWRRAGFRLYWRWRSRQRGADRKLAQCSVLSSGPWLWRSNWPTASPAWPRRKCTNSRPTPRRINAPAVSVRRGDHGWESCRRPNQRTASPRPCVPVAAPLPVCAARVGTAHRTASNDSRRAALGGTLPTATPKSHSNVASSVRGSIRNPAGPAPTAAREADHMRRATAQAAGHPNRPATASEARPPRHASVVKNGGLADRATARSAVAPIPVRT